MRATRALVHLQHLQTNIAAIKQRIGPKVSICLPIKADAYGHGAIRIAIAGIQAGISHLAVASIEEAAELRSAGIVAPILLLSLPMLEEIPEIVANGITPLVADLEFIKALASAAGAQGERLAVHLKIDTGMGRIGCRPEAAADLAKSLVSFRQLNLEGCATHLAVADSNDPADLAYTQKQLKLFDAAIEAIKSAGIDPGIRHAANSGAIVLHPEAGYDMVRPGLLIYGYPPVADCPELVSVKPVMELDTRIVFLKPLRAGESISYGRSWTAQRDSLIATLPIGYADGLNLSLSGRLQVLIRDRLFPVVGRICMDQCMVDLGDDRTIERWEPVMVFGPDPRGQSAADLARLLGSIPYEITCGIDRRVPRVYIS